MRKPVLLFALVCVVLFSLASVTAACKGDAEQEAVETAVVETEQEQESTEPPDPTKIPGLVEIGTHLVGDGISPGIYWGLAGQYPGETCSWKRLNDLSGELDGLIASDIAAGQFYVEVEETDMALETKCELIPLEHAPIQEMGNILYAGTYLIGRDIEPGKYQGDAGDGGEACYWEHLSGVTGDPDALIKEDNSQGTFVIEVAASDYALKSDCPLERVSN